MRKLYSLFLVMMILASGCTVSNDKGNDSQSPDNSQDVNADVDAEDPIDIEGLEDIQETLEDEGVQDAEATDDSDSSGIIQSTIEEQVLVDNEYVKITATGINYDHYSGPEIELLIENLSDMDLTIQADQTAINNIMVDHMMSVDVAVGKKSNDTLGFYEEDLAEYGINEMGLIEVSFHGTNMETMDRLFDTELIAIPTSSKDTVTQDYQLDGDAMVDQDGVTMVALGMGEDFMGPLLKTAIKNDTENIITVQASDVSANGFMMETIFSADILPGKIAYPEISFMSGDLADNEISKIEDIELKINVLDQASKMSIFETESIHLAVE